MLEFEDALLDGVLSNDAVGEDGAGLADAVRAVNGLGFDGRVPPGVEEIDVIGRGEVEPGAAGFQAEKEDGAIGIGLEVLDALLAVVGGTVEVLVFQIQRVEAGLEEREQAGELGEYQRFVAFVDDLGELFEKHVELGAVGLGGFLHELRMAGDLTQTQKRFKDVQFRFGETVAFNAFIEVVFHLEQDGVIELALFGFEFAVEDLFGACGGG